LTSVDHPFSPPVAAAVERLGWLPDDPALREAAPTAARGHNVVVMAPPAPAYAVPVLAGMLSRLGDGIRGLLLCPEAQLAEWGGLAGTLAAEGTRIQVARGTARAMRRLKALEVDLLVTAPETALALHRRSALDPDAIGAALLAWPETWESTESLTPLMQDLRKDAQRIICTAALDRTGDLVERYARRALTIGAPPAESETPSPAGPVRTAGVSWERRPQALADLIEILDPASAVIWTVDRSRHADIARALPLGDSGLRLAIGDAPPAALVVAFDPPTPERLRQLLSAGEVVLLVPPGTAPYVERIASPRRPVQLPGIVDAITAEAADRRATIARTISAERPEAAVLTLAPLFERYDPAVVAAALYQLWTRSVPVAPPAPEAPATARIYVGIGKKDGATVNDLVAVLTKEVRVDRAKIGRVELRETYALVELPATEAEDIASALSRATIRRKRVMARVDRGPARPGGAGGKRTAPRPRGSTAPPRSSR
jgi:ATP-dependent RNA helicase DeaD